MNKKKILIISVTFFLVLFIIDRFTWMPARAKQVWLPDSGKNLGDPIAYKQSFEMDGSKIIFKDYEQKESFPEIQKNRESSFYLAGCYFGSLYIYDANRSEMIIYSDY